MSSYNSNGQTVIEYDYADMAIYTTDGVVSLIEITGEEAATSAGLRPGMTLSEMESIYGTNYTVEGGIQYIYTNANVSLTVLVIDDEVIKIEVCDNALYN